MLYPVLRGVGPKQFLTHNFLIFVVSPPLLVINDRSLSYISLVKFKKYSYHSVDFKVLYRSGVELTLYWVNDLLKGEVTWQGVKELSSYRIDLTCPLLERIHIYYIHTYGH